MKKRIITILSIALVFLTGSFAQGQIIELSADKTTANPGDIITFTIRENQQGVLLDRREYTFDGHKVPWNTTAKPENPELIHKEKIPWIAHNDDISLKDGKLNYIDTVKWVAKPGAHVLRLLYRWFNAENKPIHLQKFLIVRVSGWEKKGGFNHPGLSVSAETLDKIKINVFSENDHPMKKGWKSLNPNLSYIPHPHKELDMYTDGRKVRSDWDNDGVQVHKFALKWAISGDARYGAKAAEILNAWGYTCEKNMFEHYDTYQFLHGTNSVSRWLYGAEILKHYNGGFSGWSMKDRQNFDDKFVRRLLVPMSLAWQGNIEAYACQNQALYASLARINIGIYLDDEALFNSGYNYLMKKTLPSKMNKEIFGHDPASLFEYSVGPDGQYMEINRDMGHMKMTITATQDMAEVLWNQGYDMYGMILEGDTVPRFYQGMLWLVKGNFDETKTDLKGMQKFSGMGAYERIYNHYRYRLKNKYPVPADMERYVFEQRKSAGMNYNNFPWAELNNETPPAAPSDLTAESSKWYQVKLSWKDNAYNESGYMVERSTDEIKWELLKTISPADNDYIDTEVLGNAKYWYRVCAGNANGKTGYSNVKSVKTPATPLLGRPLYFRLENINHYTVKLSWFDNSASENVFEIERSENGKDWNVIAAAMENTTTYTDQKLFPSVEYSYRIRAKNKSGYSEYSDMLTKITFGDGSNNITIEAESVKVGKNFSVASDSVNKVIYIEYNNSGRDGSSFPPGEDGQISYKINIPATNTYYIWGYARGLKGPAGRAFWFKMDDEKLFNWGGFRKDDLWKWYHVANSDMSSKRVAYKLNKGAHILTLAYRTTLTQLDKFIITDDPVFDPNKKYIESDSSKQ